LNVKLVVVLQVSRSNVREVYVFFNTTFNESHKTNLICHTRMQFTQTRIFQRRL